MVAAFFYLYVLNSNYAKHHKNYNFPYFNYLCSVRTRLNTQKNKINNIDTSIVILQARQS